MKPDQMPTNLPPGSAWWHHRGSGVRTVAIRIHPDNRAQIAAWCGGHPWAAGVIVPTFDGGEIHANAGNWITTRPDGWWEVWPHHLFTALWKAE